MANVLRLVCSDPFVPVARYKRTRYCSMSRPPRGRDYMADYDGQLVPWPENDEVDWAQAFPIPESSKLPRDPRYHSDSNDEEICDEEFWFSPRMAALLHHCGCLYADMVSDVPESMLNNLPSVAQPYARNTSWVSAYVEASRRLVARLEKGQFPRPNCTGEEMALHKIMEMAEALYSDGDEGVMETLEGLPKSTIDEDFDLVLDLAFEDGDVLMLYGTPGSVPSNGFTDYLTDFAGLGPDKWFQPFRSERVNDHVRQ